MVFNTSPDNSGILERMRITEGGNVGIGTSNPSNTRLYVHNTSAFFKLGCYFLK